MFYNRAEIICSYLKMNNKDDEFKISLCNEDFTITQNNKIIFNFINLYKRVLMHIMHIKHIMKFTQHKMINYKCLNTNYQIIYIDTLKMHKNYNLKYKLIYYSIDLNKKSVISYGFKKKCIEFIWFINTNIIRYRINIRYYNRFIYKFHDAYLNNVGHFKYTNYKICIPNKYELLYYSNYLLIYL